ncbi:MAG: hypothetical protein A2577_14975 [Bdellovibrionales bacterium RIFOXYD1_FULL_36_51]|nr:MAG: hypothetical protein A2417_09965 [Bdellovibrionales bacterium RIFOXYC1_FULL_37_79]OFZ64068.1 MAG: hypothetical protein A2577_14975 [Bdellovibrionales bacterium RIFOXYD1_FULL_36_51]
MNNKFEKFLRINMWISKYLLFALPTVVGTVIWALFVPGGGNELHGFKSILWEIFGWHFMIWFVLLVYFIVSLFCWGAFREKILTVLTFSKERDERESYISGRASRATFFSTLAALILLFFLSGLHLHIYKKPKEEIIDGKRGTITIGYKFEFVNSAQKNNTESTQTKNENILTVDGIPLTQESIILFLILYHIASYHIFSRKRLKE